ncbi:MAG: DUF3313 domain-containing protein [Desulfobacterota bacterium]|jgi:hypothetical protein|nr:DUF3313 domain-containing protein [Thermodesulfobacteriota bacterium]
MKKSLRSALAIMICFAFALSATSCASVQKPKQTGFLGEYYKDLKPGPKEGVKFRWIKPGTDFSKYKKMMIDPVVFYFAPDSEDKGIDPEVMKELGDIFNQNIMDAVTDKSTIVAEPGPDVLRIKVALTGIRQSRPVLSGVSSVVPVGLVVSVVKKGTTDAWVGSGATGMEAMFIDTATNEVVAAGQDEQVAGFTDRFTKYGSAKEAFKFWAERLKVVWKTLQATGKAPE